jgi:hypothetical protein
MKVNMIIMFYFYIIFNLLYNNKVCRWFHWVLRFPTPINRHDKTETLLKGAINTITITPMIIKTSLTGSTIRDGPFNLPVLVCYLSHDRYRSQAQYDLYFVSLFLSVTYRMTDIDPRLNMIYIL